MDMSVIIVLWVVVLVIQNVLEKKKPQRPTSNPPPDFEIPTLANDPNFPNEEPTILLQDLEQSAEVREINLAEIYRQKKLAAMTENKIEVRQTQLNSEITQKKFSLDVTPSATMNALILGEILGKPRSKR